MKLNVQYTSDLVGKDPDLRLLIYGPERSGKTSFAGTFPAPIILAPSLCKSELSTLLDSEIPVVFYKTADEAVRLCKELEKEKRTGFKQVGPFRTIIIENMTVAAQMWLQEFESGNVRNPQRDIWGRLSETILQMYRTLHAIDGTHVVWICHDSLKYHIEGEGKDKRTVATGEYSVPGNAFRDVISKTCIVAHTELKETDLRRNYQVWFKKHGVWNAGGWFPVSRKLARDLEFIGAPKHKHVHYDVLAEAMGLPSQRQVEDILFGKDMSK